MALPDNVGDRLVAPTPSFVRLVARHEPIIPSPVTMRVSNPIRWVPLNPTISHLRDMLRTRIASRLKTTYRPM